MGLGWIKDDPDIAAKDAGRDPDALKISMLINLEHDMSVVDLADKITRYADVGTSEALVDASCNSING
jgi:hypothetical protein